MLQLWCGGGHLCCLKNNTRSILHRRNLFSRLCTSCQRSAQKPLGLRPHLYMYKYTRSGSYFVRPPTMIEITLIVLCTASPGPGHPSTAFAYLVSKIQQARLQKKHATSERGQHRTTRVVVHLAGVPPVRCLFALVAANLQVPNIYAYLKKKACLHEDRVKAPPALTGDSTVL